MYSNIEILDPGSNVVFLEINYGKNVEKLLPVAF